VDIKSNNICKEHIIKFLRYNNALTILSIPENYSEDVKGELSTLWDNMGRIL